MLRSKLPFLGTRGSAGRITTLMVPASECIVPSNILYESIIETGTIGTPAFCANLVTFLEMTHITAGLLKISGNKLTKEYPF